MYTFQCEFCSAIFKPRPQVKRPRACSACQDMRQRENERYWHAQNRGLYDGKYHRIKKTIRIQHLQECARRIVKLCEAGSRFFGEQIESTRLEHLLSLFLEDLGIRAANKFWEIEDPFLPATL